MTTPPPDFRLVYRSLSGTPPEHSFPCGPDGEVDLDRLDTRTRNNYFFARAMVGHATTPPRVERASRVAPIQEGRRRE